MSINIPRAEHPNPQFERKNWRNLNGEWEFEIDNSVSGIERELYKADKLESKITVPFCPESKLSGIGNTDFMNCVWYRREIDITADELKGKVFLRFGAVDYEATVYINSTEACTHKGGYVSFKADITALLKEGTNVITVCAKDDVRSPLIPRGKQSERLHSWGCDYTRTTGIWQTVWLEFTPETYVDSIKLVPNAQNSSVSFTAKLCGKAALKIEALYEGRIVGYFSMEEASGCICGEIKLSETHLWEVGCGRLYDLRIIFGEDEVSSYFGLRSVRLDGYKFLINEESVFQRLVLDQGFYPDGIYTAPSDEALVNDIKLSLEAGFNGARLHQKVFEERFLYHCDKMGYIVWGEFPNWGLDYSAPDAVYGILPEWCEEVERDFNHPSIVGWCPFNETWDYGGRQQRNSLLEIVYRTTKQLDPTRPCIDTSGNFHVVTDIYDVHDYEQDPKIFSECYDKLVSDGELYDQVNKYHGHRQTYRGEATFVSEYGGIKWVVGESDDNAWGYGNAPKTEEEFINRYKGLTDVLLDNELMFGFCYTQLYDVEQEQNGLYTYDREPKFDMEIFRKINSRKAAIEK